MEKAPKNQVINSIEDTYLKKLNKKYTGSLGVTCRNLPNHLINRYIQITTPDLESNSQKINEPINLSFPIDKYFERIDDCDQYAAANRTPYTEAKVIHKARHTVLACEVYDDARKEGRKIPANEQMWIGSNKFFADEYYNLKLTQNLSSGQRGYHSMNAVVPTGDIDSALYKTGFDSTADQIQIKQMVATTHQMTDTKKILREHIKKLSKTNKILERQGQEVRKRAKKIKVTFKKLDPNGYC